MTAKLRTQKVDSSSASNFLKKALECHRAAAQSFTHGDWNAAAICAIHSSISACDALCAHALGLRHAGERHSDAVTLLMSIRPTDKRFKGNVVRLRRVIDIKNMAEYEERLVFRKEAEKALKDCERFLAFVIAELPQTEKS
jgi:HEPN domain-containing protein